jgi:acetyl esterase
MVEPGLAVEQLEIEGHAQCIALRIYRPAVQALLLPVVLYFHGGGFVRGGLDDADFAARFIAAQVPATVISVAYSLAPAFPFPAAPEDAYRAARWVTQHGRANRLDASRIAVAGHDAGGNLATILTFMARDRGDVRIAAQVLLAPLLDPSMTRLAEGGPTANAERAACSACYRAYLPFASQRYHPYAAPLESQRLGGLPPALIASAEHDLLHVEAEKYAAALISAGVPTQVTRHRQTSHEALGSHEPALREAVSFFQNRLVAKLAASA